jgi:hypothetical protein
MSDLVFNGGESSRIDVFPKRLMLDLSQENLESGSEINSSLFEILRSIMLKRQFILSGIGVNHSSAY